MKLKSFFFCTVAAFVVAFSSCKKDDLDVGANVQPSSDLLDTYSNVINLSTNSFFVDSTLSKADYLYLGQYTDTYFGTTQAEYLSQIDARLDGVELPETKVVSIHDATSSGIVASLLHDADSLYGNITKVTDPKDFVLDSAFFYIRYDNNFIGDTTSLQSIDVYALSEEMPANTRYFTNVNPEKYCDKKTLLGSLSYQVGGQRVLQVPLDMDYAKKLISIYLKDGGSKIKNQQQFNKEFKGIYVAASFNEGAVVRIEVSGLLLYYHYQGVIHTTYDGKLVEVDSKTLGALNPLVSSLFLSCNKSVERCNVFAHPNCDKLASMVNADDFTYVYSPSGVFTAVDLNFQDIVDSVTLKAGDDFSKVMINSARIKLSAKNLNWPTKLDKAPNTRMLILPKDSLNDFFYWNRKPDGLNSFVATYDTASKAFSFDISRSVQKKLNGDSSLLKNMIVVPVYISSSDNISYYHQQLWLSATRLYGNGEKDKKLKPRIDLVFSRRD